MGDPYDAICNRCGERCTVSEGGRLSFFLLHCERSGEEHVVGESEIPEPSASRSGEEGEITAEE